MKRNKFANPVFVLGIAFTLAVSCTTTAPQLNTTPVNEVSPVENDGRIIRNNNESSLSGKIKHENTPVAIVPGSNFEIKKNDKHNNGGEGQSGGGTENTAGHSNLTLSLIAGIEPPVVDGTPVQASHVIIK